MLLCEISRSENNKPVYLSKICLFMHQSPALNGVVSVSLETAMPIRRGFKIIGIVGYPSVWHSYEVWRKSYSGLEYNETATRVRDYTIILNVKNKHKIVPVLN
jgi:hypothetical protein